MFGRKKTSENGSIIWTRREVLALEASQALVRACEGDPTVMLAIGGDKIAEFGVEFADSFRNEMSKQRKAVVFNLVEDQNESQ